MPFLVPALICSDLTCGQLIIRQKDMYFVWTFKEGFEVLYVELVTSAMSFDQSDDEKCIVLLKDLLLGIVMEEVFIERGSVDIPIIKEIHLTKPFLQAYLWERIYQLFLELKLAVQKLIKPLNSSLVDVLDGARSFEIVLADMQESAETKWDDKYSSAVTYSCFLFYLQ